MIKKFKIFEGILNFNIGDKVIVKSGESKDSKLFDGKIGVIIVMTSGLGYGDWCTVQFGNGDKGYLYARELEMYKEKSNNFKFKVGDIVKVIKANNKDYLGQICKIVDINPEKEDFPYKIEFSNKSTVNFGEDEIELYDEKNKELKIKVGDYVKVINWEGLTENQENYLKSKPVFTVLHVCNQQGEPIKNDEEPYVDVGYKIPLKMNRFESVDKPIETDTVKFKIGDYVKVIKANNISYLGRVSKIVDIVNGNFPYELNIRGKLVKFNDSEIELTTDYEEESEKTQNFKFKVGDRVRIKPSGGMDDVFFGRVGNIIEIDADGYIEVKFDEMLPYPWYVDSYEFEYEDLELYEEESEETQHFKFKVGDRVMVIETDAAEDEFIATLGHTATIERIDDHIRSEPQYLLKFDDEFLNKNIDDGGYSAWYFDDELELIDEFDNDDDRMDVVCIPSGEIIKVDEELIDTASEYIDSIRYSNEYKCIIIDDKDKQFLLNFLEDMS